MNDSNSDAHTEVGLNKNSFSVNETDALNISSTESNLKLTESSENTIRRVLSGYEIGQKLRHLRLRKKIALTDLGKHTGLSASMLSQLENGKLVPTLPTLARIAMVFDVGLEHFFTDKRAKRVFTIVRAEDRLKFPENAENPVPGYFFEVLAFGAPLKSLSAYLAEFPKSDCDETREHAHDGSEFVHVLEGTLAINYQATRHLLQAGDSVYFDASEAHSYCGHSELTCKAIVITAPPPL
jgi:transcriptional regulator with XRE-family HTH domain